MSFKITCNSCGEETKLIPLSGTRIGKVLFVIGKEKTPIVGVYCQNPNCVNAITISEKNPTLTKDIFDGS